MTDNGQTGSRDPPLSFGECGDIWFWLDSAPAISGTWPGDLGNLVTSGIGGTSGESMTITTSTSSQFSGTFTGVTLYGLVSGSYSDISGSFSVPPSSSSGGGSTPAAKVTITVLAYGSGSNEGTITSTPAGINCVSSGSNQTGTCSYAFPAGNVTLTATPSSGAAFYSWSGCTAQSGATTATNRSQRRWDMFPLLRVLIPSTRSMLSSELFRK